MAKFVEFTYKNGGEKFFINIDNICNIQPYGEDHTMIAMMPHLDSSLDDTVEMSMPFVCIVVGNCEFLADMMNERSLK